MHNPLVYIVVEPNFGERLRELPPGVPVWIVSTPANETAARRIWAERPPESHLTGITIFDWGGLSPEDAFLDELDTIDLHHGIHSADPPYSALEVIGVSPTDRIIAALAGFGFAPTELTNEGFRAARVNAGNEPLP